MALAVLQAVPAAGQEMEVRGRISKVIVYRGQALVTRSIKSELSAGTSELVVADLPAQIVPESLYAQADAGVGVLSVRYRQRAVREDTRAEVQELEAQIERIESEGEHLRGRTEFLASLRERYGNFWKLAVDASNADLNRGVLQSKQLTTLAEYLEDRANRLEEELVEIRDQQEALAKELKLLQRRRGELAASSSRTQREAVLFVRSKTAGQQVIELSYLVNGANWIPQYNVRAHPGRSIVSVEYNAVINQTSGEDWGGVSLSLSTAEPTMVAAAAVLEPMEIGLAARTAGVPSGIGGGQMEQKMQKRAAGKPLMDRSEQFKQLLRSRREQARGGKAAQVELGRIAMENQALVLNAAERELAAMKEQAEQIARSEGISVTYKLAGALTLPSRTDQQLVTIASPEVKGDFTLLANPLMTDYVYLQADVLNDSETILLPGTAGMFRDGEFVGRSEVPVVTIGQRFTAGFGIDSQVQVRRELEDKDSRVQGGNRIDTYHYRIALSNYKDTAVELRLLDRLPHPQGSSVKLELEQVEPALSGNAEYQRAGRKKGILRWDLTLVPNSKAEQATVVRYTFTLEYDKNMRIQPLG